MTLAPTRDARPCSVIDGTVRVILDGATSRIDVEHDGGIASFIGDLAMVAVFANAEFGVAAMVTLAEESASE